MNPIFWILLVVFPLVSHASERVRHVIVSKDQIVTVRTAIGIATIVQVPDRPNSVVVGDQEAFKVEYLDQAITIKPLKFGAKSNLYVYTDWQRYNVQLATGAEATSDFVVYLDHAVLKPDNSRSQISWHQINRSVDSDGLKLEVDKVATTPDQLLLQIEITSNHSVKIDPAWIWIAQGSSIRPINSLVLSGVDLTPESKISGMIQVKRSDIKENEPIRVELRRKKKVFITVPKVAAWKK
jgi:hypothetical protein